MQWAEIQSKPQIEQENWLLQHGGETPKLPEPYKRLLQLRRLKINTFSGGLYNQPHYQQAEFEACMDAEAEVQSIREANRRLKANK